MTGVALGGNKIREFEYSLAPAVQQSCDILLNSAAAQSNQSRQTVAAANKLGMRSIILAGEDAHSSPVQGNLLLYHLLGAEVHMIERDHQEEQEVSILEQLRRQGHCPWDTGYDGAVYRRVACVDGFLELWDQLTERRVQPDALYLCSGDHAHVGLLVAAKALGIDLRSMLFTQKRPWESAEEVHFGANRILHTCCGTRGGSSIRYLWSSRDGISLVLPRLETQWLV